MRRLSAASVCLEKEEEKKHKTGGSRMQRNRDKRNSRKPV